MKRLSSWALPIILGVAGLAFIIVGSLDLDSETGPSLAPIATPTPVARASATPAIATSVPASTAPTAEPTRTPLPEDVTATQLDIPSVGIMVLVRQSTDDATDNFPPDDAAYILSGGNQPGRNMNSYIFAHAVDHLFKPLWNIQIGAEVLVQMSDESVLRYVITEVRPNVPCPDPNANPNLNPAAFNVELPLALQIHDTCDDGLFWTANTTYERLTLQTSQGYNRNWGELVIVAELAG